MKFSYKHFLLYANVKLFILKNVTKFKIAILYG